MMQESGWYPPGAEFDINAPYNQVKVPEKDFDITCSQSLSKTVVVTTNNYIPGSEGVDYEPDGEGGFIASGWHDDDDTSNTNWGNEYDESGHYTPLQLIQLFKAHLENELLNNELPQNRINQYKHLIEECDDWVEDDVEYLEE